MTDSTKGKRLAKLIDWFLYEPIAWEARLGNKRNDKRCAASVHRGGREVGFRQCLNAPKHILAGYGWCGRHFKEIAARIKAGEDSNHAKD